MSKLSQSETKEQRSNIRLKKSVKSWFFFGWFIINFFRFMRFFTPFFCIGLRILEVNLVSRCVCHRMEIHAELIPIVAKNINEAFSKLLEDKPWFTVHISYCDFIYSSLGSNTFFRVWAQNVPANPKDRFSLLHFYFQTFLLLKS